MSLLNKIKDGDLRSIGNAGLIEKHLDNESPAIKSRARKLFKKIII